MHIINRIKRLEAHFRKLLRNSNSSTSSSSSSTETGTGGTETGSSGSESGTTSTDLSNAKMFDDEWIQGYYDNFEAAMQGSEGPFNELNFSEWKQQQLFPFLQGLRTIEEALRTDNENLVYYFENGAPIGDPISTLPSFNNWKQNILKPLLDSVRTANANSGIIFTDEDLSQYYMDPYMIAEAPAGGYNKIDFQTWLTQILQPTMMMVSQIKPDDENLLAYYQDNPSAAEIMPMMAFQDWKNYILKPLLDAIRTDINAAAQSSTTEPTEGGGEASSSSSSHIMNVTEHGILNDGMDYTTEFMTLMMDNPGKTFYFPKGNYTLEITAIGDLNIQGEHRGHTVIAGPSYSATTLLCNNALRMDNISIFNFNENGVSILCGTGSSPSISNCNFIGFENKPCYEAAPVWCNYNNCTFTVEDQGTSVTSLGTCIVGGNYVGCTFNGRVGADVINGTFHNCEFSGDWGVHMPFGEVDDDNMTVGTPDGATFNNCSITGTSQYGIGLGNRAYAIFNSCTVIGYNQGIFVRSESKVDCYNTYIGSTRVGAGSSSIKFVKFTQPSWPTYLTCSGDSKLYGCHLIGGDFSIQIPDRDDAGTLTIVDTTFNWNKVLVENSSGTPQFQNNMFKYIYHKLENGPVSTELDLTGSLMNGDIITPIYNTKGMCYINTSSMAGTVDVRLTKWVNKSNKLFDDGFMIIIRSASSTDNIKIKNGYYAAEGTLVENIGGSDLILNANESAVYIYYKNTWKQI